MKRKIAILLLIMSFIFTGCGNSGSSGSGATNKDISLNDMKTSDTCYLQVNGKTLAFPFTLNDFFKAFPEYEAYGSFDGVEALFGGYGKIDLKQKVGNDQYVELKIIKKSGEEDDQTKVKNSRFYIKAFSKSDGETTLGDSVVFDVSYQYTEKSDFGSVKLNGIEINKTTIGEVQKFLKETYGDCEISRGAITCGINLTSSKFKGIEYLGKIRYPRIYVSIDGYSSSFEGTEVVNYVDVTYSEF